ncbi:ran-binding protein 9-like [Amphiura filiformis]|uniref:ran-binding protein 9-like n=1 Tax=Amphiura filiformis TaxID=82378 RepID=UPI003B215C42
MATNGEGTSSAASKIVDDTESLNRLKRLYPAVNEEETPLPRSWNSRQKSNIIGLSQNNLRVHYKGAHVSKTNKEAASVTTLQPIPQSCGIYYFEVTVISKGRDGYMGIGLATEDFLNDNSNKLPGWTRTSYGYHGDNGHTFFNSPNNGGQAYGPTFTTGDVIGCGVNLIDNTCFYTKNGVHLGVAFTDLPSNLYPAVGLQTPGEIVDTNFGQSPFVFNVEDLMQEMRMKTQATIARFPVPENRGEWQSTLHRLVSTYLVHHGYCATAECFARHTGQTIAEELASIKNRQRIQKLVLDGRMGEAIETTQRLYPGLLERNTDLDFMLKCRQFVEMVNGTDSEIRSIRSPRSLPTSRHASPAMSPHHESIASTSHHHGAAGDSQVHPSSSNSSFIATSTKPVPSPKSRSDSPSTSDINSLNSSKGQVMNGTPSKVIPQHDTDIDMDSDYENGVGGGSRETALNDRNLRNGVSSTSVSNGVSVMNGSCQLDDMDTDEIVQSPVRKRQLCGGNIAAVERMLTFGRELQMTYDRLPRDSARNEANQKALQDAFSLLAYSDPWSSPVGYQLNPVLREPVCASLNSAILESQNMSKYPPLEMAIGHAKETMKLMSKYGPGSCAFTSVEDYLH